MKALESRGLSLGPTRVVGTVYLIRSNGPQLFDFKKILVSLPQWILLGMSPVSKH